MVEPLPFESGPDGPSCPNCGYQLRGVRSPICPECGKTRQRRIAFFDRVEFDAIHAALDHAGIRHDFHDPRVGIIGMLTLLDGVNLNPVIMLDWSRQPAAQAALEDAGLSLPVAIVDPAEPFCPCCGAVLPHRDPTGGRCAVCATQFAWFEGTEDHQDDDERNADDEHTHAQSD